jgi:hypothetical protein
MKRVILVGIWCLCLIFASFLLLPVNADMVVDPSGKVGIGTEDPMYRLDIHGNNEMNSYVHLSIDGSDTGAWITSVSPNNLNLSSGAAYDADLGGWIQKSSDGLSSFTSWGGACFRIFAQSGGIPGSPITPIVRFRIDFNGNVGIGTSSPSYPLQMASGAHVTAGGVWTDASSREYKQDISNLDGKEAKDALEALNPVRFRYKSEPEEEHLGFIGEDVPALVATNDRKGISPMDIVAVLTKVVQEQQKTISELSKRIAALERQQSKRQMALKDTSLSGY